MREWSRVARVSAVAGALLMVTGCGDAPPKRLALRIVESQYGEVVASAPHGSICHAAIRLPGDAVGGGHSLGPAVVSGTDETVSWRYSTSPTAHGTGFHTVKCTHAGAAASVSAAFTLVSADHD